MYSGDQYYHINLKFPYLGYSYSEKYLPGYNITPLNTTSLQQSDTMWLLLAGVSGLALGLVFCGLLMYLRGRIEKVADERPEVYARLNGDDTD